MRRSSRPWRPGHQRADRIAARLEQRLAHADLHGRVANVVQEDRDLDDVRERAARRLGCQPDVVPDALGLRTRVADADDVAVLVEGHLPRDVEGVAAAAAWLYGSGAGAMPG